MTPEKYLIALNCTKFVSHLRNANLSSYLQSDDDKPYTILAPQDEALSEKEWQGGWSVPDLPDEGTPAMADLLRYHTLPGQHKPSDLNDSMLLDTVLRSEKLKGASQKMPVTVTDDPLSPYNAKESSRSLIFGNAVVVGDPGVSYLV